MKKIDITQVVSPTSKQPLTVNSLNFLQLALDDDKAAIIKSIVYGNLGSYSLTVPYVISGCVVSDTNKDVTSGEIFYGGKFYEVVGVNGVTNVAQFVLTKTYDATADPLKFSDNVDKNVHEIWKFVGTDTATSGTFDATDFVSVYGGNSTITTSTTSNGLSIDTDVAITYSTDSYVYSWFIDKGICTLNFKVTFTVTSGAVVTKIHIPLPDGLDKSNGLSEAQAFRGGVGFSAPGGTTNYLMLQSSSNDDGSEGQRITLTRYSDGDTQMTLSNVATTVRGEIKFPIA